MSLINQALKKAQQERNQPARPEATQADKPSASLGEPRSTHAETRLGFRAMHLLVGGTILITAIVGAVALTVVLLSPKPVPVAEPAAEPIGVKVSLPRPEAPEKVIASANSAPAESVESVRATAPPESVPAPSSSVAADKAVVQSETATEPLSAQSQVPTAEPQSEETAAIEPPGQPSPVSPEKATTQAEPVPKMPEQPVAIAGQSKETPAPPPDAPLPGAEPNPKVLAFLESSRITGIKVAGVHSRLLMNNQVYRGNDIVHAETQLRIKKIEANEILFVDESGIQYRKQFRR